MSEFPHQILPEEKTKQVVEQLQQRLVDLIDLGLQLKQAHWCVIGNNFRTVHLQLDEILVDVRDGSDEVAERVSTLGMAPDGLAKTVADSAKLKSMNVAFASASDTIKTVAQLLDTTVQGLRSSIEVMGDLDPITEDLLIGISAGLEKHLWMVQAQEK
ncbi:MAG: DNA starvation/stationary phase protection protein [Planctomyces sp.]|nr:DNA starvation/stationary phase protection protein [Planctomyces sp.]